MNFCCTPRDPLKDEECSFQIPSHYLVDFGAKSQMKWTLDSCWLDLKRMIGIFLLLVKTHPLVISLQNKCTRYQTLNCNWLCNFSGKFMYHPWAHVSTTTCKTNFGYWWKLVALLEMLYDKKYSFQIPSQCLVHFNVDSWSNELSILTDPRKRLGVFLLLIKINTYYST